MSAANWRCARNKQQCDVNNGCRNGVYGWCWNKVKKSKKSTKAKPRPTQQGSGGLLGGLVSSVQQIADTVSDVSLPKGLGAGGAAGDENRGEITYYQGVRVMCGQYVDPQGGNYAGKLL